MSILRIAVVQQHSAPGQVETNRAKALTYAEQALRQGADLVLFHEELLIGYVPNVQDLAETVDGPTTHAFQGLLQDWPAARILYGLTERERGGGRDGDRYYIAAPLVSAEGVLCNYRKTHLWWDASGLRNEPTFYQPGESLVTFELRGARCGVMICYDGDYPELARAYARRGCDVVCWLNDRESRAHAEVRPLARANSLIIASACCCGPDETGRHCEGASNITNYDGKLLTELWDKEGVLYADVDPEAAARARHRNPWFVGYRPELYR
jgi:predicted amidohydrolase